MFRFTGVKKTDVKKTLIVVLLEIYKLTLIDIIKSNKKE